jgi:hypothetical protein
MFSLFNSYSISTSRVYLRMRNLKGSFSKCPAIVAWYLGCVEVIIRVMLSNMVSSKQTKINHGSNKNKPKQDLFRVCFGLFRETKKYFGLFRCFKPISKQPKQTELFCNKLKQIETTLNCLKNTQIYYLLSCLGGSSVCFGSIETSKHSVSV